MDSHKESSDIYEALKFLHFIGKPMGVMVWTLVGDSGSIERKYVILKKDIILSVLMMTTVISGYVYYFYKCPFYVNELTTSSYIILQSKNLTILISFLYFLLLQNKNFLKVINEVHCMDKKVQILTGKPVQIEKLRRLFITFTSTMLFLVAIKLVLSLNGNTLYVYFTKKMKWHYCPHVSNTGQKIFIILFGSFSTVFLQHLKEQVVSINQNLEKTDQSTFVLCGKISQVRVIYNLLLDIYKQINIVFRIPFVLTIVMYFLNILSSLYYLTGKSFEASQFSIINFVDMILWVILNISEVFIIIYPFTTLHDESKKTIELMENIQTAVGRSNIAYKQVELFSVQMYIEDFKFNVFGYFPLDWTLLHSMVAGITTYLIIFHQFSNLDRGPTDNSTNIE